MSHSNVVEFAKTTEPPCGCGGAYTSSTVVQQFPYGEGAAQVTLEAAVPVWTCDACGDAYTDGDAEKIRHAAVCDHLGRLTPENLVRLRNMRSMTQDEWADYTAIGVASIKRWETGTHIQNASTDRFLRLLSDGIANARYVNLQMCDAHRQKPVFKSEFSERELREAMSFQLRLRQA